MREAAARAAVRGMVKASLVGLIPALCFYNLGGFYPVGMILVGMPTLLFAWAGAREVYRELHPEAEPPPPPRDGPEGLLSQAEAARHIAALNARYRGGD